MAKILIAGAGKLGTPLSRQLSAAGHELVLVRRSPPQQDGEGMTWCRLDLRNRNEVDVLDRDFDLIIIILTPASRSPDGYRQIYQKAISNLLDRMGTVTERPACLFVSATSVYGQNGGEWVDEDSTTEPGTYNGRSLLDAENAVRSWSPRPLIVRFAGIYGPNRTRLLRQLEKPLTIQSEPPVYANRIHEEDCVGILRFLAERQLRGENRHPIYLGADDCPTPKYEMMRWLARASGQAAPLPVSARDNAPQNKRCSNRRLLDAGYRLIHPDYRSGYASLLRDLHSGSSRIHREA